MNVKYNGGEDGRKRRAEYCTTYGGSKVASLKSRGLRGKKDRRAFLLYGGEKKLGREVH